VPTPYPTASSEAAATTIAPDLNFVVFIANSCKSNE
jgi:hypothetical protein